jgi:hypothetical protein
MVSQTVNGGAEYYFGGVEGKVGWQIGPGERRSYR